MAVSQTLIKKRDWRASVKNALKSAIRLMTTPFSLLDLYPSREELDEETGIVSDVKKIHPHQQAFHDKKTPSGKDPQYLCFNGGFGSGKTTAVVIELLTIARRHPGIIIVSIVPFDYFIDETLWPSIREIIGDEADCPFIEKVLTKQREWHFTNGSLWRFKAYDDAAKIKGWQCHILHFFEASELGDGNNQKARAIFQATLGRWRAPGNYPKRMYLEQNPKGHNWTWALFVKDSPMRDKPLRHYIIEPNEINPYGVYWEEWERTGIDGSVWYTISSTSGANSSTPKGFVETMMADYSDDAKKRFILGGFDPINQLIYEMPVYSEATHVVSMERVLEAYDLNYSDYEGWPSWWPVVCGIDVGGPASPWACEFYIETPNQELICFAEFYKKNIGWLEVSTEILRIAEHFDNVTYFVDPISSKQHVGPTLQTVEEEFQHYGITVEAPKGYNKYGGIAHVSELLLPDKSIPCPFMDDYYNEETEQWEVGRARIYYIAGECRFNLIEKQVWRRDIKKLRTEKEEEEGLSPPAQEKPVDRDDHAQTAEMFATLGWWPREPTPNRRRLRDRAAPHNTYGKDKRRVG